MGHLSGLRRLGLIGSLLAPAVLTGLPAGVSAAARMNMPLSRLAASSSSNWSGYTTVQGPFTSVSASWVQPVGTCTAKTAYSSFWVGIDGDGSNTVEQTGSEVDCIGGHPQYYSWYEMYPAGPVNYSNPVSPGDVFTASVTASGPNFTLTLTDKTKGWTKIQHKVLASASKHSAEIIAEAPSNGRGVLPLADFGTINFTAATANGKSIGAIGGQAVDMQTASTLKASTSALTGQAGFSVTWHHT